MTTMEQGLMLTRKECQVWLKILDSDKRVDVERTVKIRVMAPYLYGEDFLPAKWRRWMDEAKFKTHIEKWLEVEPIDVYEFEGINLLKDVVSLLTTQIETNVVDFQRFMNLAVLMDKETELAKAKALADEEISFHRLWERHSTTTERSKTALMTAVYSYIQFAVETVKKKDHPVKMPPLHPEDEKEVELYKTLGNDEYNKEDYRRAVMEYNLAINKNRYSAVLYNNRCVAFLNMKNYSCALIDSVRAVTLDQKSIKAQYRFAQAIFELGYHDRSLLFLVVSVERCRREAPQDPALKDLEALLEQLRRRQLEQSDSVPALVDMSSSGSDMSDIDRHDLGPWVNELQQDVNSTRSRFRQSFSFFPHGTKTSIKVPKEQSKSKKRTPHPVGALKDSSPAPPKRKSASKDRKKAETKRTTEAQKDDAKLSLKEDKGAEKGSEKGPEEKAEGEGPNGRREWVKGRGKGAKAEPEETKVDKETTKLDKETTKVDKETTEQNTEESVKKQEKETKVDERRRELNEIQQELRQGSEALLEERGRHAFVHYKTAMDLMSRSSQNFGGLREEDYVTFLYAYGIACLESGIDEEILDASSKFETILNNHSRIRSPLPYYGLSFALYKQNKFSDVFEPLKKAVHMADHFPIAVETWPGTKHKITETVKGQMKIALQKLEAMCKDPPRPDAICRLSACPQKPEMYLNDVGFRGYVKVVCREKCHMDYHVTCWKKIKAEEYPDVTHERELLTKPCHTPDCDGVYISVTVFGPDGLPKREYQLDEAIKAKEKKNKGASKLQPKKTYKQRKQDISGSKQKGENNIDDETTSKAADGIEPDLKENNKSKDKKLEGDLTGVESMSSLQVPHFAAADTESVVSSNTGDGDDENDDFEDAEEEVKMDATYVLKKDDLAEEQVKPGKSKPRKKKGKDKTSMQIEFKFTDTSQRQMLSSEHVEGVEYAGALSYPMMDPDTPFSVPTHLQGAIDEFSREFKLPEQPSVDNSSEEEKSQIAALHMHFEEVLQRLGPMSIADSRLGDELQQLPRDLQSVIDLRGGLKKFLLQSETFLMIEDHICVVADKLKCQDVVAKTRSQKSGLGTRRKKHDWDNSRANLAPEHFPNISEALAGDSFQQKRQQNLASIESTAAPTLDTPEENFVDTIEARDQRMQAILTNLGERGIYKDAKNLDFADREKVRLVYKANPGMYEQVKMLEQIKYYVDREDALEAARKKQEEVEKERLRAKKRNEIEERVKEYQKQQEVERLETERQLEKERLEKERQLQKERQLENKRSEQTEANSEEKPQEIESLNDNQTTEKGLKTDEQQEDAELGDERWLKELEDIQIKSKHSSQDEPSSMGTLISSGKSILNSIFFPHRVSKSLPLPTEKKSPETARKINSMPPGITYPEAIPPVYKSCPPDLSSEVQPRGASNFSVDAKPFISLNTSNKPKTKSEFNINDYIVEKPESPSEGTHLARDKMKQFIDPNQATVGNPLENSESGFYSSSTSGESIESSIKSWESANEISQNVHGMTSAEALYGVYSNSPQQQNVGETPTSTDNTNHANSALSKQSPTDQLNPDAPSDQTCASSDTIVADEIDTNPKMRPSGDSNPATSDANPKPQTNNVTQEMYQNLWKKYKMLFEACKVYSDRRMNMKSTWTQYSKTPVKTRGINTGPDKVLEDSKANEQRLTMNLNDIGEKYSRLKERYDVETARLRDDVKRLGIANNKYEAEQSRFGRQLQESKKFLEMEKSRFNDELLTKDAQIQNLDATISSLSVQLRSTKESLDRTLEDKQTQRDLWMAEKVKLEEAAAILEQSQKAMQNRCQDAELNILQLRCVKDVAPLEATIRECKFHIESVQNAMQRTPSLAENWREISLSWQKCLKENQSLLDFQEGQYKELEHRVRSRIPLNQLEVPKPVRPTKYAGKPPPQIPPNLQRRGAPGVGMPFGLRLNAPGVAPPSGLNQQMQAPPLQNQPTLKTVAAVGSGNQMDSQIPVQQNLPQPEIRAMERERIPTPPSAITVSMAAPRLVPDAVRSKETFPTQNQHREVQNGVSAPGNEPRQPVSRAQFQAGSQQPPSTTAVRMQGASFPLYQGFPQMQPQAVRQPQAPADREHRTAVTSVTNSGLQQVSTVPFQNAMLSRSQTIVTPSASIPHAAVAPEPVLTPSVPQPKTNFEKIIFPLQTMFPKMNKVQLTTVVKEVRAANKGSLSGLSIEEIIGRAAEVILSRNPQAGKSQGLHAQASWAAAAGSQQPQLRPVTSSRAPPVPAWKPVKSQPVASWGAAQSEVPDIDVEEDPCVICHEEMITDTVTLHCGHKFHPACIKLWLQEQLTCPTCRNYTLLTDEYPAPK